MAQVRFFTDEDIYGATAATLRMMLHRFNGEQRHTGARRLMRRTYYCPSG